MSTKNIASAILLSLAIGWTGCLNAQQRGPQSGLVQAAASEPPGTYVEPLGVPLAPAMYLSNFLLLYFSSPDIAANMPAYKAALPQEVYECLVETPSGCPFPDMAKYFAIQALGIGGSRNKNSFWPDSCRTDPQLEALAPRTYRQPDEINQRLGRKRADRLAQLLGIVQEIVLTPDEYKCQIGKPPRDPDRQTIVRCTMDLTNSKGIATVPLSSYGLSLNEKGEVRSNCAPDAPCLEFNGLATDGSLLEIARECGFEEKLGRLFTETPLLKLLVDGVRCQREWLDACIVEAICPGNGPQSNNGCAPSSVNR